MSELINENAAAHEWVTNAIRRHSDGVFGKIVSGVIWTNACGPDGNHIVPTDPQELVFKINNHPHILLHEHDPGRPKGKVIESAYFETEDGHQFVAAVLGLYAGGDVLSFADIGFDASTTVPLPRELPELFENLVIEFAIDPRELDEAWVDAVTNDAPVPIQRTELSHNAESSALELIRVALPFVALVFVPYVTAIATEAGKATYAGINGWVRQLLAHFDDRRNPVLDLHSFQNGCQVSFLFRGTDKGKHSAAMDALPNAATQAAQLVERLRAQGTPSRQLIYEFDKEMLRWAPSFAVLDDDRMITDDLALITIEQLPNGLSLGLTRKNSLPRDPVT
ncbi:hypothetical protein [Pseudomonas paracarnis]|uniref:hypothetical protein n=1 Tax=Pseudomonas paracarnis TaxID=2750625 RepID=UPI00191BB291|nr:hypothetical protein [Pseudomonas paracarnis]